jgi:Zn-finger nucleic acid-binding protein
MGNMKCPACHNISLVFKELDEGLPVHGCARCEGVWIKDSHYWKWLKDQGATLSEKPNSETLQLPVKETKEIKVCPGCGHFLTKRDVGHGVEFHVDRCLTCGGIWLDKNEWEVLKSRNLHDEIHQIFSAAWQREIRQHAKDVAYEELLNGKEELEVERKKYYEEKIAKHLGNDYSKVHEFKNWLDDNELRGYILAYLKKYPAK